MGSVEREIIASVRANNLSWIKLVVGCGGVSSITIKQGSSEAYFKMK
jgi:hypothetical protein